MPPKVISGGDNPYDIHDAKLSSSATAHESSSVTAHEISNILKFHSFFNFKISYFFEIAMLKLVSMYVRKEAPFLTA